MASDIFQYIHFATVTGHPGRPDWPEVIKEWTSSAHKGAERSQSSSESSSLPRSYPELAEPKANVLPPDLSFQDEGKLHELDIIKHGQSNVS